MAFPLAGLYGPQTVVGQNGVPFVNSAVTVYLADGITAATLYTDQTMGTGAANPVTTDNFGNLAFYTQPGVYILSFTVSMVTTTLGVQVLPYWSNISTGLAVEAFKTSSSVSLSTSPANIVSVSLVAGTWRINGFALVGASDAGSIDAWIGPNSASITGAYAGGSAGSAATAVWDANIAFSKVVTLGSTTTVYLQAAAGAGSTGPFVGYQSINLSIPNVSGISASQLY